MKIGILFNRVTWEIKQLIKEFEERNIGYELINNQNIFFRLNNFGLIIKLNFFNYIINYCFIGF